MNAFHFLTNPVVDALGWTLLHAVWQGFLLVLPVALALHLLRNRSSMLRYRVSVLTLMTQLLLSAATFVWYYKPASHSVQMTSALATNQAFHIRWQTVAQTLPWHQQLQQFLETHLSQFVLVYLIGVCVFGLRLAGGWLYLQRLSQTAIQPNTVIWTHLTEKLRLALAIKAVIRVRESARIAVPMVVGIVKPILLLPIGLTTHLTTSEIESVLAHELAHIKRQDYAVNLLQSVIEVLYFFHPALWWLSARVREEREHCCDDLAVDVCGGDGRTLAQALAHIEELRLIQLNQTPALAMAFASKQQHLLHRVRRVLGVPTRPLVSNHSLAGLTLATILLMSVSVYAMQKQDRPKSPAGQPHPAHSTRRHKAGNGTEFGITDNKKVDYIIWNGHKLSATRVTRLQRQLDRVMAGTLALDAVPQADRDILLTLIETNHSFQDGMNTLVDGLSHIDYSNIVASSLNNIPISPDGTVEGLAKVDYNTLLKDAFASIPNALQFSTDSLEKQRANQQRLVDSLSRLMEQRSRQIQNIHLQMEKMQFPIDELQRSVEVLNWRKDKLMQQRNALIEKHQRLLQGDGKQKLNMDEVEKQLNAIQPEIKKLEGSMEELNSQFESLNAKQEEAKLPMEKLEREAEQLNEQMQNLSEQITKYDDGLAHMMPDLSDSNVNVNVDNSLRSLRSLRSVRPARAPMPPRPASVAAPAIPHLAPAPPVAAPRAKIATPPAVKPVLAPKPPKQARP
ncbi:M56 family metallopeptidase [Spirosoma sp. KNUC1025]|uniref:M56 family metallopeptidase n=1 Tax=Spirosoma sp. KNUC1025 TaxID=2894082 RepID=UPI0038656FA5|nr:M48 family metalloprotease [Spirosoma sp. KNUC1025]